uniref:(northern house mosquito) hypothetical protein n=1 Tax=Culex pipiens TaxID=7175 RepID=A0A8D8F2W7_CULPI
MSARDRRRIPVEAARPALNRNQLSRRRRRRPAAARIAQRRLNPNPLTEWHRKSRFPPLRHFRSQRRSNQFLASRSAKWFRRQRSHQVQHRWRNRNLPQWKPNRR